MLLPQVVVMVPGLAVAVFAWSSGAVHRGSSSFHALCSWVGYELQTCWRAMSGLREVVLTGCETRSTDCAM